MLIGLLHEASTSNDGNLDITLEASILYSPGGVLNINLKLSEDIVFDILPAKLCNNNHVL